VNDEPGIRSLGCRLGRTFLVCDRRPVASGSWSTSVSQLSITAGPPCARRPASTRATVPPRRRRTTRRTWPLRTARESPATPVV